jgi:phospholipid/cholesterol/gamma-HCH transport system permease protein
VIRSAVATGTQKFLILIFAAFAVVNTGAIISATTAGLIPLKTLSTNPFRYLIAPRVIGATLTLPVLVLIADIIGILGGSLVGVFSLKLNFIRYMNITLDFLTTPDITSGLIKSTVFGFVIAIIGCYNGYNSKGGAEGVGRATTNAVVQSSILILCLNYLMTELFFV